MKISEISQLIEIRAYAANAINNFNLDRLVGREMGKMLTLLDKRITDALLSEDFKNFINFKDADKSLAEAVKNNDIKKGIDPSAPMKVGVGIKIPDHGLLISKE